jgi:hypothetical protein
LFIDLQILTIYKRSGAGVVAKDTQFPGRDQPRSAIIAPTDAPGPAWL